MKSRFLFSHKLKPLGWVLFCIGMVVGIILIINDDFGYFDFEVSVFHLIGDNGFLGGGNSSLAWSENNITDELTALLIIIGGILVVFSKTKDEDEYISKIRMESLIWATYVNYAVLLFTIIFIYGGDFLAVMIYNMFTILLFFILRFHYVVFKSKKGIGYEE